MLGAQEYPITLAEMHSYATDADGYFKGDEHEKLKSFLAVHPEYGEKIAGANGVRQILWPVGNKRGRAQIVYYFHDLNMPLFLLAIHPPGEHVSFDEELRQTIADLVNELVAEYSKQWARVTGLDPIA